MGKATAASRDAEVAAPPASRPRRRKKRFLTSAKRPKRPSRFKRSSRPKKNAKKARAKKPAVRLMRGADLLAKVLRQRGLNYSQFAKEFGVSRASVTRWLNGQRAPNREHMLRLQNEYGITIEAWLH